MYIPGKTAVITGASSGIGRALALELGLRGATIVIAARSLQKLAETAALLNAYGIPNITIPLDLNCAESLQNFLPSVLTATTSIDILVNNAAVGLFESTVAASAKDVGLLFQTNLWGPLTLMQQFAPLLKGGTIVNISSAAAKYAPFHQGIYAASKAALERMTEAMGVEEKAHMRTLLVIADRTATPFMDHVLGSRNNVKLGLKLKFASPEYVATRIATALENNASVCFTTGKARLYTLLSAAVPTLVENIVRKASR